MSNVLAIETSSRVGSIALRSGGRIAEAEIATPREQTQRILGVIEDLLGQAGLGLAGLDALVFGRGPGSFTGVRVAAAVAQGIALSTRVPVAAVSSLAALAERARRERSIEHALVCVDAHMGEVYWAEFRAGGGLPAAVGAERLGAPEDVTAPAGGGFVGIGDGFAAYADALAPIAAAAQAVHAQLAPRARDLLALAEPDIEAGRFIEPEAALPVYLRDESAWER